DRGMAESLRKGMPIIQTRRPEVGRCNICGLTARLTVDHAPPKGYARAVPVRLSHISDQIAAIDEPRRYHQKKSSDGVNYRSLCLSCNSDLLGSIYDPGLISLGHKLDSLLNTPIRIPATSLIRIQPQKVMKSVLGH